MHICGDELMIMYNASSYAGYAYHMIKLKIMDVVSVIGAIW